MNLFSYFDYMLTHSHQLLVQFACVVAITSAVKGDDDSGWSKLTPELDARLRVNRPLLAEDQCWYTWIEFRNRSEAPIYVRGVNDFFQPAIKDAYSGEFVPNHAVKVARRYVGSYLTCEPGIVRQPIAYSHGDFKPVPFNYKYRDLTWKVRPGKYLLSGKLRCDWRNGKDEQFQEAEVLLQPLKVEIWRAMSEEELQRSIYRIRKDYVGDPNEAWALLVRLVRPGMARSVVERILPKHPYSGGMGFFTGGFQVLTYWIDKNWKVSIAYDYTGEPRDKSGTSVSRDSPHNRVIAVPTLVREDMPPPIRAIDIRGLKPAATDEPPH